MALALYTIDALGSSAIVPIVEVNQTGSEREQTNEIQVLTYALRVTVPILHSPSTTSPKL